MPSAFWYMIACYGASNALSPGLAPFSIDTARLGFGVDALVPFNPWFLPLYLSFFSFWYLPKRLLLQGEAGLWRYRQVNLALMLMTTASCCCFLLFPLEVELRPPLAPLLTDASYPAWLIRACGGLYAFDAPFNAWPSIHVSQPLLIMLIVSDQRLAGAGRVGLLWIYLCLVVASVLFMKQHFAWDVYAGIALALLCWRLWLRPRLRLSSRESRLRLLATGR
jgi:hypothetical protein